MVNSILLGLVLTIVTVGIHATGTTWWINHLKRRASSVAKLAPGWLLQIRLLGLTTVVLLLLHILEVVVWAMAYLWIGVEEIKDFEDATYFSTVTFTTLGYGDVVLAGNWRMLAAVEAMVGLLIFGWSTALLFAVVQRLWQANSDSS